MKDWQKWIGAVVFLFAMACSSVDKEFGETVTRLTPIEPPTFLNADIANLFGNASFSARVEVQKGLPGTRPPMLGDLSGRDGSLFFISDEQRGKRGMAGGLSALWDASTKRGYLLNEPLQGYAPMRHASTNIVGEAVLVGEEEMNGERCRKSIIQMRTGGELVPTLIVWRSVAQQDLPMRIQTTNSTQAITMSLSRVRMQAPPAELFALPNGFKAYETTDAMLSELVRRQTDARDARAKARRAKYGDTRIDDEDVDFQQRPVRPY